MSGDLRNRPGCQQAVGGVSQAVEAQCLGSAATQLLRRRKREETAGLRAGAGRSAQEESAQEQKARSGTEILWQCEGSMSSNKNTGSDKA
ncbi:hypothetical protein E2C01_041100 [Portunus trituberculatus]|uniref:Uncharacterized protein n=1 Tax=Portunus trituberculatus TaxID=210409 RepID=A0A5B7FPH2_PORTR|nr:hypothetical protein [Portunus trituberculatus]